MDLCEDTVRMTGEWVAKRWWYQEVLYLAKAISVAAPAGGDGESE